MQAIQIEHIADITRVLVFEINEELGSAHIEDIMEADEANIPALVALLQEKYPNVNAVKVDETHEGAVAAGNVFVLIPDAMGVFELAQIVC